MLNGMYLVVLEMMDVGCSWGCAVVVSWLGSAGAALCAGGLVVVML